MTEQQLLRMAKQRLAKLLRNRLQRDLDAATTKGLEALKVAAEKP